MGFLPTFFNCHSRLLLRKNKRILVHGHILLILGSRDFPTSTRDRSDKGFGALTLGLEFVRLSRRRSFTRVVCVIHFGPKGSSRLIFFLTFRLQRFFISHPGTSEKLRLQMDLEELQKSELVWQWIFCRTEIFSVRFPSLPVLWYLAERITYRFSRQTPGLHATALRNSCYRSFWWGSKIHPKCTKTPLPDDIEPLTAATDEIL